MSLREVLKELIQGIDIGTIDIPVSIKLAGWDAASYWKADQILTAIKEEGYICVGKETVKKIMGEEEGH